ncbi:MAG: ThiF family adenylyltransferase [Rhabdochlamydiaceae bacterium]|nr:ThiF family adenylyltransferase [Rhabdochlamydiaceae bacterium]
MNLNNYYSRQLRLPEVGAEGQLRLSHARCLVVGAGGLGSAALPYLAAAGIGTVGICDGDCLDVSNLHRQPIYSAADIGTLKAELAAKRMRELNPMIKANVHPVFLNANNAFLLFSSYDLILDCTDNFKTKFLINDAAYLAKKPVVRASIYQFEGQLQTYLPERKDACLRCMWQKVPEEGCVGTCQEVGVLGSIPGFFGVLQANEAIKFFLGLPVLQSNQLLFSDLIHYTQQSITLERNEHCPLCGTHPSISSLSDRYSWEITPAELDESFTLIDIREKEEVKNDPYLNGPYLHLPMSCFDLAQLDSSTKYALFCQRGRRSASVVSALYKERANVFSILGGIEALR